MLAFEFDQGNRRVVGQITEAETAFRTGYRDCARSLRRTQSGLRLAKRLNQFAPCITADPGSGRDRLASLPTVNLEVIGDTAHCIQRVTKQIYATVLILIDGVMNVTGGNELRITHGAGI